RIIHIPVHSDFILPSSAWIWCLLLSEVCLRLLHEIHHSISQVSHSCLSVLLPSIIFPSSYSQTALHLFPCRSMHKCTHNLPFPASSATIFTFLRGLFTAALCYWHLSTFPHHIGLFSHTPHL